MREPFIVSQLLKKNDFHAFKDMFYICRPNYEESIRCFEVACELLNINIIYFLLERDIVPSNTKFISYCLSNLLSYNLKSSPKYAKKFDFLKEISKEPKLKHLLPLYKKEYDYGKNLVMIATHFHDCELLKILLSENNFDLDEVDYNNYTALFHAVFNLNLDSLQLLLQKGANLNHRADKNYTCFDICFIRLKNKNYQENKKVYESMLWILLCYGATVPEDNEIKSLFILYCFLQKDISTLVL